MDYPATSDEGADTRGRAAGAGAAGPRRAAAHVQGGARVRVGHAHGDGVRHGEITE